MDQDEQYDQYIKSLYKKCPYIEKTNWQKFSRKLFNDEFSNNEYYKDDFLDQIYLVLSSYIREVVEYPENKEDILFSKDIVMQNVTDRIAKNIASLSLELNRIERDYKELKDDYSADIKADILKNKELLQRIKEIISYSKNFEKAVKLAKKEGIDLYLLYYNTDVNLSIEQSELKLFNAMDDVLFGNELSYIGEAFRNKEAFKISADNFIYLYSKLEQTIDRFDIQSLDDPKFKDFKKAYIQDFVINKEDGQIMPENKLTEKEALESDKAVMNYAITRYNEYCDFRDAIDLWLPRALCPLRDGSFIVTKDEVDSQINYSALINLQYEYDVIFDFFKQEGVELTLTDEINDVALFYLKNAGISEEELNEVYKREEYRSRNISYSEISKEFLDDLVNNQTIIEVSEEMEKE